MGGAAARVAVTREAEPGKAARREPAELARWAASAVKEERQVAAASQTEAVQAVLSAAALVAAVPVVQEQAAPEQVAPEELLAVRVVQEQAAPEQVAPEELAVPAAPARAAAVVHRMVVWG